MDRNPFACECRDDGFAGAMLLTILLAGALAGLAALSGDEIAQGFRSFVSVLALR